jgi:single-stranded-DNA-specific exonuclease
MTQNTTHNTAAPQASRPPVPTQLHPVIARLFEKRGFDVKDIQEFMSCNLRDLPDLTALKDISKASDRIIKAIDNGEKIGIYGDYDVDGTTSCALFHHFFEMHKTQVELIQPSRFIEGYGLHISSIDKALEMGIEILITVDCGITNCEAAEYAKERGLDLIITDHHKDAADKMPDAYAIVNPSRRDEPEDSVLVPLAGVAVAFAICLQIKNTLAARGTETPSLYPLLQFVAIGTICDMAKLTPMNIKLVRHGLKQIKDTQYPGIKAFFSTEERKLPNVPSEKLSFNIGPMINSKGRLDHPEKALELLIAKDSTRAYECYSHLEISNNERKFIQGKVVEEAKQQILRSIDSDNHKISIAYEPHWHEGVIGIVASRLVEDFKAPAIVFTDSEEAGIIKASARSAGTMSIFDCLKKNEDLFLKFGGHTAAAGLSMPVENLPVFKKRMNALLDEIPAIERTRLESYDLEIEPQEITPTLLKQLETLEPFGMGNPKPIFKMQGLVLSSFDILKEKHIRWNFTSLKNKQLRLKGISFNYVNKWNITPAGQIYSSQTQYNEGISAFFTLGINRFNGNEYIQLMVENVKLGAF